MSAADPLSNKLQVLSLLQAYNDTRVEQADTALQSAVWNLTKARRTQRGFGALPLRNTEMTAATVRWDVRPRVGVVSGGGSTEEDGGPAPENHDQFQMVDVSQMSSRNNDREGSADTQREHTMASKEVGLRQRKKGTATEETTKEWVEESSGDHATGTSGDDPLVLLGGPLPPKELRTAHAKAVEAVEYYCKAASLVAAIQQRLNEERSK